MTDILIATHNGEKYLSQQLDSLFRQSYQNFRIIINDDGSTDKTPEIIEEYKGKYPDRIEVISKRGKTRGAKDSFFELMTHCKSDYALFCDQDDVWMENKIEEFRKKMTELENGCKEVPALVFSDLFVVDKDLNLICSSFMKYEKLNPSRIQINRLLVQNVVTGCALMVNRKLIEMAVKCSSTADIIMHDWWCALVAAQFGRIGYVNQPLVKYRQHGLNSIGAVNVRSVAYGLSRFHNLENVRKAVLNTEKQALLFSKVYELAGSVSELYGMFPESGRLKRLHLRFKYSLFKNGLFRNLGLLLV